MIRPMIVITTSISTRVKPCSPVRPTRSLRSLISSEFFDMTISFELSNKLGDRQQCSHDRNDQSAHNRADRDNGERPDDGDDAIEAALQIGRASCRERGERLGGE